MEEDALKRLWLESGVGQKVDINSEKLVKSINQKLNNMEKLVNRRDWLEIFLALVMMILFSWWLILSFCNP